VAEDSTLEHDERHKSQRIAHPHAETSGGPDVLPVSEATPAYQGLLPGDPRLNGRGNQPMNIAVMQRMQQTYGNRAVQRRLANNRGSRVSGGPMQEEGAAARQTAQGQPTTTTGSRAPVQRQVPPGGTPGRAGAAGSVRFDTPKIELEINKTIGSTGIKLKKVTCGARIVYSMLEEGQEAGEQPGTKSSSKVRAGAKVQPGHGGAELEITESWKKTALEEMTGFQPEAKGLGEITSKDGKIGIAGQLKGKSVSFGLEFRLVGADWEKGKVEFAQLVFKPTLPVAKREHQFSGSTGKASVEITENWEIIFDPDYAQLTRWVRNRFVQIAGSELAIGIGFVAAGITTLVVNYAQARLGGEINQKVQAAMEQLDNAGNAYHAGMTGRQVSNAGGAGWEIGANAAASVLKSGEEKVPQVILMEEARKRNLKQEAFDAAWPRIRQNFIDQYKKEHYIEQLFYGDDAPGLKQLTRVLDAAASRPGRR
jgi:hypothetical protein